MRMFNWVRSSRTSQPGCRHRPGEECYYRGEEYGCENIVTHGFPHLPMQEVIGGSESPAAGTVESGEGERGA